MSDAGELAGAAALVWRDGKAHITTVGWRNVDTRLPIERDTIFRIASMTKPVTSTAALMLFEEGRFALDDPITRWAPEVFHRCGFCGHQMLLWLKPIRRNDRLHSRICSRTDPV